MEGQFASWELILFAAGSGALLPVSASPVAFLALQALLLGVTELSPSARRWSRAALGRQARVALS